MQKKVVTVWNESKAWIGFAQQGLPDFCYGQDKLVFTFL